MKISFFVAFLSCFSFFSHAETSPIPTKTTAIVPTQSKTPAINLNSADVKTLSKAMKGVGIKRAEAIVKYREMHGEFKSVEDLAQVPGFGQHFVEHHLDDLKKTFVLK